MILKRSIRYTVTDAFTSTTLFVPDSRNGNNDKKSTNERMKQKEQLKNKAGATRTEQKKNKRLKIYQCF